ncbi:MAG TPA: hypothetical protein VFH27_04690, partial [Longimicrobiaceae bacterium]|nr:hypothetical protein [Longimicrobiaceae bacterium]
MVMSLAPRRTPSPAIHLPGRVSLPRPLLRTAAAVAAIAAVRAAHAQAPARPHDPAVAALHAQVRAAYSGDRAFAVTA